MKPPTWFEAEVKRLEQVDFKQEAPIIIYQMGKVGSQTVYRSLLEAGIKNPVYSVHMMAEENISKAEDYYKKINLPDAYFLDFGRRIREKLAYTEHAPLKIITMVRDPIARELSQFFYHPLSIAHPILLDPNGHIDNHQVVKYLRKTFMFCDPETNYTLTWFDNEFKQTLGIDIYRYPFDYDSGYKIISHKNIDLLILRTEDLNQCFTPALMEFLQLVSPIEMVPSNEHNQYKATYKFVKEHFSLPASICARFYESRYAKHFYNETERSGFFKQWSKNLQENLSAS
jgi:hypothetical protein